MKPKSWAESVPVAEGMPSRDDCPTCNAQRDWANRLPIGPCGDECIVKVWRRNRG